MIKSSLLVAMVVIMAASVCIAEVKAKITANSDIIDVATPISLSSKTMVSAGDEITIVATMDNVNSTPSLATAIMYDSSLLKFVKVQKGEALVAQKQTAVSSISAKSPDRLMIRVSSLGDKGISGTGEMFIVTLKALKQGEAKIDFVDMEAYVAMINNAAMPQKLSFNLR